MANVIDSVYFVLLAL